MPMTVEIGRLLAAVQLVLVACLIMSIFHFRTPYVVLSFRD